jgi:predicted SAM-dependent methyltransferase
MFFYKLVNKFKDIFNLYILSHFKWKNLLRRDKIWLELGSGQKKGANGWVTIDLRGADISYNLSKGIPMPDNSVDKIYSSHMFEHIPYLELVQFIGECYRVLKPQSQLSICVPNARLYIENYLKKNPYIDHKSYYEPAVVDTGSSIDQLNYIAYMGGHHHYMFDQENILNTLKKQPFSTVDLRDFNKDVDLISRDFESIYAIAIK